MYNFSCFSLNKKNLWTRFDYLFFLEIYCLVRRRRRSMLAQVTSALESIAPFALADSSWDNVGVLLENPKPKATGRVMLTIDLTPQVLKECLDNETEVLVAYHPPIFSALKRLQMSNVKQAMVLQCAVNGVSIVSPHTALDAAVGGINDWLCDLIGLGEGLAPIEPATGDPKVRPTAATRTGYGRRMSVVAEQTIGEIVDKLKKKLALPTARVALADGKSAASPVKSVAVCAGSGSGVFRKLPAPVDLVLTGELSHHDVLALNAMGSTVVLLEHTNTERGYLSQRLAPMLREKLPGTAHVTVAKADADPLVVW